MMKFRKLSEGLHGLAVGLAAIALSATFAMADVNISASGKQITLDIEDATLLEVAGSLSDHLNVRFDGRLKNEARVTAVVKGEVKEIMSSLFGQENFMLVYNSGGALSEILIFDSSEASFVRLQSPTDNLPSSRSETPGAVPSAEEELVTPERRKVRQVGDSVTAAQTQKLATQQSNSFGGNKAGRPGAGTGAGAANVEQLQRQTVQNLEGLVKALNALCPPGQTC